MSSDRHVVKILLVEVFVRQRTDARFSHGICPDCARQLYPGLLGDDENQT